MALMVYHLQSLWKENRYLPYMRKTVDKRVVSDLLDKGRTHAKDFYSVKTGKTFESYRQIWNVMVSFMPNLVYVSACL